MKSGVPAIDPYPIKFIYNVSQIFLCAYMTIEAGFLAYRSGYSWVPCNAFNKVDPPLANLLWLFYISKVWDFWDTIFIVLGKKWRQLSFLHVYHHFTIFLFYWLNANVMYDGDVWWLRCMICYMLCGVVIRAIWIAHRRPRCACDCDQGPS